MTEPIHYDVFLKPNQADKPRVRRLAERLRAARRKPKAEGRRQNEEIPRSSFFIRPSLVVGLERSTVGRGNHGSRNLRFRDPANARRRFILLLQDVSP